MKLTNEERETIILFDETPDEATVFTYNRRWQKHFEQRLGIKPIGNNGFGGKTYKITKNRIPLPRVPRKMSPEQKKKLGQRLKKARQKKDK